METNMCNLDHHLDADALLPPRKRLLAGFKRQNSDVASPLPSRNDVPLNNPFMARFSDPSLSIEEIVEASRIAAIEAAKVAEAAKAKAEEKATKASKAFAAAKSALDLVVTLSDEATKKEKCLKKNKMKNPENVEELYGNRNKGTGSCGADEELARDLHRSINSSPRILNNSDVRIHKHKKLKLKSSNFSGKIKISEIANGEGNRSPNTPGNDNGVIANLDSEGRVKEIEGRVKEVDKVVIELNTSKPEQSYQQKVDSLEILDGFGKKRGKMRQKKLPLSICSFRNQSALKEKSKCKGKPLGDTNAGTSGALFSSGSNLSPVERASMWKCQSVKVPACLKQRKVMRS